jgi:hypothetical protein
MASPCGDSLNRQSFVNSFFRVKVEQRLLTRFIGEQRTIVNNQRGAANPSFAVGGIGGT